MGLNQLKPRTLGNYRRESGDLAQKYLRFKEEHIYDIHL